MAALTLMSIAYVTDMIDPGQLGLAAGTHTVTLHSLLIDETAQLTVQ